MHETAIEFETERRPRRMRHEIRFRQLIVQMVEQLSPNMIRVTFGGDELDGFFSPGFDDHVKMFFPAPGQDAPVRPQLGERGAVFPEGQPRPIARDFTPRLYDAQAGTLAFDFALHDNGPASEWARQACPGQTLFIGGPRGSFIVPVNFDWHLLMGDATAIPAIARRLEELPADARAVAVIEVAGPADVLQIATGPNSTIHWVFPSAEKPGASPLETALSEIVLPDGDYYAWIACESEIARSLRNILISNHEANPKWLRASGYWRRGAEGIHDSFND